jgi:hypothetical protein
MSDDRAASMFDADDTLPNFDDVEDARAARSRRGGGLLRLRRM